MRPGLLTAFALLLSASGASAQGNGGTATGNLILDGKPVPLRFAYVVEVDNVEEAGLLLEGPRNYRVIVLSDRALPAASVANRNAPFSERHSPGEYFDPLAKSPADSIRGVFLRLDLKTNKVFDAHLIYPGSGLGFTIGGQEFSDRLTGVKVAGTTVSGTAVLAKAEPTHLEKGPKKYLYQVTFRAPIIKEPAVSEKWEGEAALKSPPIQVIREYLEAGKKSDLATLQRLTAKTHQAFLKKPEVLEFLKDGDASKLVDQVQRVFIRGPYAIVVIVSKEPSYSQTTMTLVRENGDWKVCWP